MTDIEKAARILYEAADNKENHEVLVTLIDAIFDRIDQVSMDLRPGDFIVDFELDE